MLTKFMIDTNIIDKVMETGLADHIEKRNDILICITAKQAEEISRIPDNKADGMERRVRLILTLLQMRVCMFPTTAIVGYSRVGTCVLADKERSITVSDINHHMHVKQNGKDNITDSMIAETALREGCILVTEDKDLYNAMKTLKSDVLNWDEFVDHIKDNNEVRS